MVDQKYSMAITETLHYLKGINQNDINKIPNKFMDFLKANAAQDYECNFDYNKSLKELNLMNETRGLISMICLNYWCETEEQKNSFRKHLSLNETKFQEELKNKYNIDDIFKKKDSISDIENGVENINTNDLPVNAEQENIIKRILNHIMKFLHIKIR